MYLRGLLTLYHEAVVHILRAILVIIKSLMNIDPENIISTYTEELSSRSENEWELAEV